MSIGLNGVEEGGSFLGFCRSQSLYGGLFKCEQNHGMVSRVYFYSEKSHSCSVPSLCKKEGQTGKRPAFSNILKKKEWKDK